MLRLIPPSGCRLRGNAGLALPIALSSSALLLFSSLSIQTLSLHRRQRSRAEVLRLQLQDRLSSVAMDFQQRALHVERCLLQQPASAWGTSKACPWPAPEALQAGLTDQDAWRLIGWTPLTPSHGELVVALADGDTHSIQVGLVP